MKSLYDADFVEWSERNAELLRTGRLAEADLENIAEEIESMGRSDGRELGSRITRVLEHLLKLKLASGQMLENNRGVWEESVVRQQVEIRDLLEESPSLRGRLTQEVVQKAYRDAVRILAKNYDFSPSAECPFSLKEILGD